MSGSLRKARLQHALSSLGSAVQMLALECPLSAEQSASAALHELRAINAEDERERSEKEASDVESK